jgi:hypothetical protein
MSSMFEEVSPGYELKTHSSLKEKGENKIYMWWLNQDKKSVWFSSSFSGRGIWSLLKKEFKINI